MASDLFGSGADGGLVSQVKFDEFDRNVRVAVVDFGDYRLDLALGTAGEDNELGLASSEEDCSLSTETTLAGTSDEN